MKTAALLLLLAVPALAFGQADVRDKVVDGNSSVSRYNSGRMADLPTAEADKLYMTLVTADNWQADSRQRQVAGWFHSDPRLVRYKAQMRFNWYTLSNPLYVSRLKRSVGANVPIVTIQRPNGDVLMNVTGLSMPRTGGELADMIADSLESHFAAPRFEGQSDFTPIEREQCPDGNCPVQPVVTPDQNVQPLIPEILPKPNAKNYLFALVLLLLVGGGFAVGVLLLVLCLFVFLRRPSSRNTAALY